MSVEEDARSGVAEDESRPADLDHVAVDQAPPAEQPLGVQERAVAREPLVDEHPVIAEPLERGVHAGHLRVPTDRERVPWAPPDSEPLAAGRQLGEDLGARAIAVDEERSVRMWPTLRHGSPSL